MEIECPDDTLNAIEASVLSDEGLRAEFEHVEEAPSFTLPHDVEAGKDSTVSGFEFRTIGGHRYGQLLTKLSSVLAMDHSVDEHCSLHIHLSVDGVSHRWGAAFQARMVNYIMSNTHRVPDRVLDRWIGAARNPFEWLDRFFALEGGQQKYRFVHFHSQGTWEFRCFGNVDSIDDAKACLDLSIDAMHAAYRGEGASSIDTAACKQAILDERDRRDSRRAIAA
jgi:hypothetical protein